MPESASPLDDLRREVDRIDDAIVDLLTARLDVVRRIAEAKGDRGQGRIALRPAREAAILRRLIQRADGKFPKAPLIRMWRELLAATTRAQTPFTVAVHVPEAQPSLWEMARDHFGSLTPMQRADSPGQVLRLLGAGTAQIGVLPLPEDEDVWWRILARGGPEAPRIVARLPFANAGQYPEDATAVVIAPVEHEPSGDDVTLVLIEADADTSRGRILDALGQASLAPRWLAISREPSRGTCIHLVEVAGFIGRGEPALAAALTSIRQQVLRALPVGGYPRPLSAAELA